MTRLEGGKVVFDLHLLMKTGRATSRGGRPFRLVSLVTDVDAGNQPLVMFDEVERCIELFWANGIFFAGGQASAMDLMTEVTVQ